MIRAQHCARCHRPSRVLLPHRGGPDQPLIYLCPPCWDCRETSTPRTVEDPGGGVPCQIHTSSA